jgi:hypothetical protein
MTVGGVSNASTGGVNLEQAEQSQGITPEDSGPPEAKDMQPVPMNKDGSYDLSKLSGFTQLDGIPDTAGDAERCSCNSSVAALVAGGKDKLLGGIQGARDEIKARIAAAGNSPEATAAWAPQLAKLDAAEKAVNDNKLDTYQLNELSSVLYQTFSTTKGSGAMLDGDVQKMQKAIGLAPAGFSEVDDPKNQEAGIMNVKVQDGKGIPDAQVTNPQLFAASQKRVADQVWKQLGPGESGTACVYNGPQATGQPNHYVTVGKDKSGQPFVYDPANTPDYLTGKAAQDLLAKKVGVSLSNEEVVVPHQECNYTMDPAIKFSKNTK